MADKVSTLIIDVHLDCATCCIKIQKVLCKIKVKENIKSISYDAKKNEVIIIGSFDPDKLYLKLRCKAGRCCIKGRKTPPEKPKKEETEKEKPKKEEKKEVPKAVATANATVNLQYAQVCVICYPWPCSDPTSHCQTRQCEGETCGVPQKCNTCAGPPRCRGCGSCGGGGGGWCPLPQPICCPRPPRCGGCGSCEGDGGGRCPPQPQTCCLGPPRCRGCGFCGGRWPIGCPGPSCTGCSGCRVVHEQKYEYHEYPPSACIIM